MDKRVHGEFVIEFYVLCRRMMNLPEHASLALGHRVPSAENTPFETCFVQTDTADTADTAARSRDRSGGVSVQVSSIFEQTSVGQHGLFAAE